MYLAIGGMQIGFLPAVREILRPKTRIRAAQRTGGSGNRRGHPIGSDDLLGDEVLQAPEIAVSYAECFEMQDGVVEIFRA
jgi:hypothetical protein